VTGSGKIESATGPKPENRASASFSSLLGARRSVSMRFRVPMAAMMSWALAFAPLAIRDGCSGVTPEGSLASDVAGECGSSLGVLDSGGSLLADSSKSDR